MNVVLTIEGRDAIPVRALAYVSNWFAAPDEIATACATPPTKTIGDYSVRNRHSLPTYVVSGSAHRSMQPVEWEPLILELGCQEKGLKADERIDGENWARWRKQAVLLLPDGAFVWLAEFQQWYSNTRPLKNTSTPATDDEGDSFQNESGVLNLDPFIPLELRKAIFSGLEHYPEADTRGKLNMTVIGHDMMAEAEVEPEQDKQITTDGEIAKLFDPIKPATLEKMFPSEGMWATWHNKAKEKGLDIAREGRGIYNPYLAALWWLRTQAPQGWDLARCHRVLAKNLPARSHGSGSQLTGELE